MNKILINAFRNEVSEIKKKFNYPKLGDAFVHLAIKLIFDLDDTDAFNFCFVGVAGKEKGIDAFVPDEQNRKLNIIQGKFSEKKIKQSTRKDVEDLRSAYSWLRNPNVTGQRLKPELLRVISKYKEYKKLGYSDKLVLLFFGKPSPDANSQMTLLKNELNCEVEAFYIDEILARYVDKSEVYGDRGPDVTIKTVFRPYIIKMKKLPRTIICNVKGEEIAALVSKYPFEIFQINVRHYLGRGNPVNKKIQMTLDNAEERKFFWYYNLGINAICDKFTPTKKGIMFKNFRIINGAQTCNTLFLNLDKLENVLVMLRVFETKDLNLATKIAISNNTQSPVKGRDLFSEDEQQIRLQKEFDKIKPPIFYERKRKEWDSLWKHKRLEALKYIDEQTKTKRVIDNETCAKGFMALKLKMPAEAKSEKQKIFVLEDFGGYYEKIFNSQTTPYQLLVSYKIITFVNEKISEFIKTYKEAEKNNFKGIKEKDLKYMQKLIEFLPHSDTHITALFGVVFENKYGEDYDFEKIYNTVLQKPEILNKIYEWLRDQLAFYIDSIKNVFGTKPFNARNYLVNPKSFASIEDFIDKQIKYNKHFLDILPI
jgi:hypothetical protein